VALALILPVGAVLPWKRGRLGRALSAMRGALALAVAAALLAWAVGTGGSALAPIGAGLGVWVIAGAMRDLWLRTGQSGIARLARLPRADWGRAMAHAGMGVTLIGIALITAWSVEDIRVAQTGESFEVGNPTVGRYSITLVDVTEGQGPNYLTTTAEMQVTRNGAEVARLFPEKRIYPVAGMPTTEAAIRSRPWGDLYLVIGDAQAGGGWAVRTYIRPFAMWIWGGAILMALGGLVSLLDRRYRVAAGARRPAPVSALPAE
jgi:cytochrome c-type biogenesis protein CcmF